MIDGTGHEHRYVSTACQHDMCGSCRNTCKFCDAPCLHACHSGLAQPPQPAWVDQARGIARELLDADAQQGISPELRDRISDDPDLFWLRGEEAPPGQRE